MFMSPCSPVVYFTKITPQSLQLVFFSFTLKSLKLTTEELIGAEITGLKKNWTVRKRKLKNIYRVHETATNEGRFHS